MMRPGNSSPRVRSMNFEGRVHPALIFNGHMMEGPTLLIDKATDLTSMTYILPYLRWEGGSRSQDRVSHQMKYQQHVELLIKCDAKPCILYELFISSFPQLVCLCCQVSRCHSHWHETFISSETLSIK